MRVTAIRTLKPNVTQEEAVRGFRSGVFSGVYWRVRGGPLQRIADAYVPFWVYRVRYEIGRARKTRYFALDAVHGALDLFEFPGVPADDDLVTIQTRNQLVARLQPEAAEEILRTKVLRVLFQQGFFKLRALKIDSRAHARGTSSAVLVGLLRKRGFGEMPRDGRRASAYRRCQGFLVF